MLLALNRHLRAGAAAASLAPAAAVQVAPAAATVAIAGVPGTSNAVLTFPTLCRLSNGTLLAAARAGSGKDSDDETVRVALSRDDGRSFGAAYEPFPETVECVGTYYGVPQTCRHRMAFFTEIGAAPANGRAPPWGRLHAPLCISLGVLHTK